jgi:hypothetical protein
MAGNAIHVSRQFTDSQGHNFSASWEVEQDKDGVWEGYFSGSCMYSVEFRCKNEAELWARIAEQHSDWMKMLMNLFP